jgi:hypothetical protein
LNGETFDPETARLVGIAFETARAAVNRPADLTDEMIARTIIELAKAGERNVEVLYLAEVRPAEVRLDEVPAEVPSKRSAPRRFASMRFAQRHAFQAFSPWKHPQRHQIILGRVDDTINQVGQFTPR